MIETKWRTIYPAVIDSDDSNFMRIQSENSQFKIFVDYQKRFLEISAVFEKKVAVKITSQIFKNLELDLDQAKQLRDHLIKIVDVMSEMEG